jgi:hypothetical protein
MKNRFKIVTVDLDCIININYRFLEYPYLCYCYARDDYSLAPLEKSNKIDEYSDPITTIDYWTKDEIISSLNTLKEYVIDELHLIEKNPNWKRECLITPSQVIVEIQDLINLLSNNNQNKLATLVEFEC